MYSTFNLCVSIHVNLAVFGHLGWFWFPCPLRGMIPCFMVFPDPMLVKKNTISPHWLLVKDLIWIYMDRISRAESRKVDQWHIHDHFECGFVWDNWDPNDMIKSWNQKFSTGHSSTELDTWARYLSSIPRCYAASPWTTVQPVARQIGHGTANRAGPLRQRKRARSCLELCENPHEISWTLERWQFIDVNHMIRSVFCPMKGIVLQHRAWTCS